MRTVLSLVLLAALLWASCTVKLGRFTLAEHVDRIGETAEAKALLEGTRGKIAPVLEDMKQRIFGEYVEAPTAPPRSPRKAERVAGKPATQRPERKATSSEAAKLPSRAARDEEAPRLPAKAAVGSSAAGSRDAKAVDEPAKSAKSAGATRAPSTSEVARLPGARRPTQP